jgi:ABC-type transport system involved in Fe-S cluster assembly fused permease/ATPase subunit
MISSLLGNLKDSFFISVSQNAMREAALETFTHLHNLSIQFHINRKTGTVLRAIDRGTKGMSTLCTFMLFNILPITLDILIVSIILFSRYIVWIGLITLFVVVFYIVFTVVVTEWRSKFRRQMNEQENAANDKAVDSLINYETVKYFCAEEHETNRYNESLQKLNEAAQRSQDSLAFLNVGQAAIISSGLFGILLITAWQVTIPSRGMTVGDFVLVNSYILVFYFLKSLKIAIICSIKLFGNCLSND